MRSDAVSRMALVLAALALFANGAYAATCSATYKPLAIDTSDEVGMARMKINYLELTADENLYVKLKGCPAGTIPPSIKYIYTQNCNKHEMGGGDDMGDDDMGGTGPSNKRRLLRYFHKNHEDASPAHKLRQHLKKTAQYGYKSKTHGAAPAPAFASEPSPHPTEKGRRVLVQVTYCPTHEDDCQKKCIMKGAMAYQWASDSCSCSTDGNTYTALSCTPSPFVHTCAPDADTLWADPLKYSCVNEYDMVNCNVMDPSQHGDDFSAGLCCPAETPNLLLNNGGDYSEARCTSAEYTNLNNQWQNPLADQLFDTSDAVAATAEVALEPMTLKDVYANYDTRAPDMLQGVVYAGFSGCDAEQIPGDAFFQMPPFTKDVPSTYFAHYHNNPIPGNYQIRSNRKLTPFGSANSKKQADGTCQLVVTLADKPLVEPAILVSIDGVELSCMTAAYSKVPDAFIALDAYTALARTTGQVPAAGTNVTIVLKSITDFTETSYSVSSNYGYYTSLKAKLDKRNDEATWGERTYECGGMAQNREVGKVNPAEPNKKCAINGIMPTVFNDPRAEALASMQPDKIGFAVFGESKNIETGRDTEMNIDMVPNFDAAADEPVCQLTINGLYDAGGDDVCNVPIDVTEGINACSFGAVALATSGMNELLKKVEDGVQPASWDDFLQFTGQDAWIDCMEIVRASMTDNYVVETRMSDQCITDYPEDTWDFYHYCQDNADHAWCADPCCNFDLQSSMCCAPRNIDLNLFRPIFDVRTFVSKCIVSDITSRGSIDGDNSVAGGVMPASKIADKLAAPDACLSATAKVTEKVTAIQADMNCCLKGVVGEFSWSDNKFSSNQPCTKDADCHSGTCIVTTSNSKPTADANCWIAGSHMYTCSVASTANAGESMAKCLLSKLDARGDFEKEIAALKTVLGGSTSATNAQLGQGIIDGAAYQTCNGDDGWRFDPTNHCQEFNDTTMECSVNCEGNDECKTMCLGAQRCNWKPWDMDYTTNVWGPTTQSGCLTDKSLSFCAAETDWGAIEDLTEPGYCQPNAPVFFGKRSEWDWDTRWHHEASSVTDAVCAAFDSELSAERANQWGQEKRCVWTANSMSSQKTGSGSCLEACTDTMGPPKKWECYVPPDASTGKCPTTGYFNERREDHEIDLPWEVSRPAYCVYNLWGPGGLYETHGDPWDDSNTAAQTAWTVTVSGTDSLDGAYRIWETGNTPDWSEVTGHTSWWEGFTFTAEANANAVCGALSAQVRLSDDGSWECGEDRCFFATITGTATKAEDCMQKTVDATDFRTEWKPAYKQGAGMCLGMPAATKVYNKWYKVTLASGVSAANSMNINANSGGKSWWNPSMANSCDAGVSCTTVAFQVGSAADYPVAGDTIDLGSGNIVISNPVAIAPPYYNSYDATNGNAKVINDCYKHGSCAWEAVDRGSNQLNWTHYNSWEIGYQATLNSKSNCDAQTGSTHYIGRHFQPGKMDDSTKCSGQYCSVLGARYSVDSAMCTSIGGRCRNTDGCNGCRAPWHGEDPDIADPKQGMCYKSGVTNATNCDYTHKSAFSICLEESTSSKNDCANTWLTCEDLDVELCTGTVDSSTLHKYASNYLGCRRTKEPRFCKTKTQCEDETGRCHGPRLEEQICVYNPDDHSSTCTYHSHTCLVGMNMETWQCVGHNCSAVPDKWTDPITGEEHCWDPKRYHVMGEKCLDYYIADENACTANGGEWLSTDMSSQREFCGKSKRCEGGRAEYGWTGERDEEQCLECGGSMISDGKWESGSWTEPTMITGGRSWKTRAMEATNTWSNRIEPWLVADLVRTVENKLQEEGQALFARCMYGEVGDALKKLAAVCGGTDSDSRTGALNADFAKVSGCSTYPGVSSGCGIATDTNVQTSRESSADTTSTTVAEVQVQPPAVDVRALECGAANATESSDGNCTAAAENTRRRHLLATGSAPSFNEASCWSMVKNDKGILVGQLLGECAKVTLGAGEQLLNGVKFCLKIKTERLVAEEYTVDSFVTRTLVDGEFVYTPVTETVTSTGDQLCATVTETGTYFCPGKVAAIWATATEDIGESKCPIMELIAQLQAAEIAGMAGNDDKDGVIPGLDEASSIGLLFAMSFFFVFCCTLGCIYFLKRKGIVNFTKKFPFVKFQLGGRFTKKFPFVKIGADKPKTTETPTESAQIVLETASELPGAQV